jgi:hypothetical protein
VRSAGWVDSCGHPFGSLGSHDRVYWECECSRSGLFVRARFLIAVLETVLLLLSVAQKLCGKYFDGVCFAPDSSDIPKRDKFSMLGGLRKL